MSARYYCICLFTAVSIFSSTLHADTNVLTNPGFETGDATGWFRRGNALIEAVDSPVNSGSYSAWVYNRTSNWHGIEQDLMGKIVEGQTYYISGYIRLENVSSAYVQCTVQQIVDGNTTYNYVDGTTANDSGWTLLSGAFTPNESNGLLTQLSVYFEGEVDVNFYLDDAEVYGPEPGPIDPNATGHIDADIRHQQIEGFGASGAWYTWNLLNHPDVNDLIDILFNQLGLDIFRIRNVYDIEPSTFDESVEIAKRGEASLGRDLKILISSWSPPGDLKSNGQTYDGGTLRKDPNLDPNGYGYVYEEFADWWFDSISAYLAAGIEVDYITIQNECDYEASWDSCKFEPAETPDFAGYDAAFEAIWNKLDSEMGSLMPKMLGPETTGFDRVGDYINNIDDLNHVYGFAHHLYNCYGDGDSTAGCGSAPDMYLARMINFNSTYGYKPLFQTEYEYEAASFENAMNTALLLHNSLTVEEVASYFYWELFWGGNSGLVSISTSSYTINPVYYAFKHYSAFIHSGWQRVNAETDNSSLRMSAYISPDNEHLSVVIINTAIDTNIVSDLNFTDFPIRDCEVYRTSQTENCEFVGNYDGAEPLILPAESITTLSILANIPPVADAGPDQSVYAYVDGWADVDMDGSGSYDDEGDPLSYHWSWSANGSDYEATGVSPTISLPSGTHTIELVVDDGISESQPDYCTVNVIAPVEARLLCVPGALKESNNRGLLSVKIRMPSNISKTDIDKTVLPFMYPAGTQCHRQLIFSTPLNKNPHTYIWSFFDKSACKDELEQGINELIVGGRLNSGRYYRATGSLWLVETKQDLPQPFHRWKQAYRRWFRWKTDEF
jgi:glucuronoarabinoxylan endo-1,4-beta-xylanase